MYGMLCPAVMEQAPAELVRSEDEEDNAVSPRFLFDPVSHAQAFKLGTVALRSMLQEEREREEEGKLPSGETLSSSHSPATMQLSTLLLALLPALAAASPTLDKYRALSKKSGGLLSLSTQQFDELTGPQRDYSLTVVLTALGAQYKCQPCQCVLSPPRPAMGERSLTLISPLAGSSSPSTRRSPSSGTAPARVTTRTISSPTSTLPTGPRSSSECVPPLAPPRSSRAEQS